MAFCLYEPGPTLDITMPDIHENPFVQRYRRTDQHRLGDWEPVGSTWKTAASPGLVAHDMYRHLPGDTGTFAQELAALGAEWYIGVQPLREGEVATWSLETFDRNVEDTVLNALDSEEEKPFFLASKEAQPLRDSEMCHFEDLARNVQRTLEDRSDPKAERCPDFVQRFVAHLVDGYRQAQVRFPDQARVRRAIRELRSLLATLSESDVPFGHDITVTLKGYVCEVHWTDADEAFLAEHQARPVVLMPWCSYEDGYPVQYVTVHSSERDYAEHVQAHFERQEASQPAPQASFIPQGEQSQLSRAYLKDPGLQARLEKEGFLQIPVSAWLLATHTPRGFAML